MMPRSQSVHTFFVTRNQKGMGDMEDMGDMEGEVQDMRLLSDLDLPALLDNEVKYKIA